MDFLYSGGTKMNQDHVGTVSEFIYLFFKGA